jgi:outer membrane protein assembly factor BamB
VFYALKEKSMQNHHGGVVLVDGVIYGASKANGGVWMAQDLQSGKTLWEERMRPNRSGSIAYADGMLYCYNDQDETLLLVEANAKEFKKVSELKLPGNGAIWAHPVIADGTLYLRDQELIFAYNIARTE